LIFLAVRHSLFTCVVDRSVDHSTLHSFPTRRSSDLHWVIKVGNHSLRRNFYDDGAELVSLVILQRKNFSNRRQACLFEHVGRKLDRKSTRLNSSHVKSSYAVFCLKKKGTHFLGSNCT